MVVVRTGSVKIVIKLRGGDKGVGVGIAVHKHLGDIVFRVVRVRVGGRPVQPLADIGGIAIRRYRPAVVPVRLGNHHRCLRNFTVIFGVPKVGEPEQAGADGDFGMFVARKHRQGFAFKFKLPVGEQRPGRALAALNLHDWFGDGPAAGAALVQADELVVHRVGHLHVARRLIVVVAEGVHRADHPAVLGAVRVHLHGLDVHLSLVLAGVVYEEFQAYAAVSRTGVVFRLEFQLIRHRGVGHEIDIVILHDKPGAVRVKLLGAARIPFRAHVGHSPSGQQGERQDQGQCQGRQPFFQVPHRIPPLKYDFRRCLGSAPGWGPPPKDGPWPVWICGACLCRHARRLSWPHTPSRVSGA